MLLTQTCETFSTQQMKGLSTCVAKCSLPFYIFVIMKEHISCIYV